MSSIKLSVDQTDSLAYITLSDHVVDSTVEHDDCVIVDLDDMGVAVGVELLDLDAVIPFDALTTRYHVKSDVVGLLRLIQPTINSFIFKSRSSKHGLDGSETRSQRETAGRPLVDA